MDNPPPTTVEQLAAQVARATVAALLPRLQADGAPIVPRWLSPRQVSAYTGISVKRLEEYRHAGVGPAWRKLGSGRGSAVRYARDAVDEWIEGCPGPGGDR